MLCTGLYLYWLLYHAAGHVILRGWCGSSNMSPAAIKSGLLYGPSESSWEQSKQDHESNTQERGQFLLWFEVEDTGCGIIQLLHHDHHHFRLQYILFNFVS